MKSRSEILRNLELQNKFLRNLNCLDRINNTNFKPNEIKLLFGKKAINNSNPINKQGNYEGSITMDSLNHDSKKMLENEFNFSKYLTSKMSDIELNKISENNLLKKNLDIFKEKLEIDELYFNSKIKKFIQKSVSKIVFMLIF